jgi:uncharacterized protein DUF6265
MWLFALAMVAAEVQPPALPEWMAGCWEQRSGDRWTEECWSSPRGAMMIGYSRSGQGGSISEWEVMQIIHAETDDPAIPWMTFSAAPSGQNRTTFDWAPAKEPGVTFVNLNHDYPQRIRYWREGAHLMAEISLANGSKPRRWRYSRLTRP